MRPPIQSTKHFIHFPSTGVVSGTVRTITLIDVLARTGNLANAADVYEGSVIKAIYLEFWIGSTTALTTSSWCVGKNPDNSTGPSFAEMTNLGVYQGKKNLFNCGQGLVPATGNTLAIFRGWLKIPKGKQRFGLGDRMLLSVSATGATLNLCGLAIYKDYS